MAGERSVKNGASYGGAEERRMVSVRFGETGRDEKKIRKKNVEAGGKLQGAVASRYF